MATAQSVIDVMLGEAGGRTAEQRLNDMRHIFSSMVNRARMTGQSIEDIALSRSQYNAYGKRLPAGVEKYRDLAEQAIQDVLSNGPVTSATYYATPAAVDNLPSRLAYETETASHRYFSDPELRGIVTRKGARQPQLLNTPTPEFAVRDPFAGSVLSDLGAVSGVPSGLEAPAVTPTEAYGQLAGSTDGTGLQNLSGQSPMAGLRSGLLAQQRDYQTLDLSPSQYQAALDRRDAALGILGQQDMAVPNMAEMQAQANFQNEVNQARQSVSQPHTYQAYQPEAGVTDAIAAIEAVSPTTQQATPSLADAYRQMGQSMEQGGILGMDGLKVRDPNDVLGVGRLSPNPLANPIDNLPAYEPQMAEVGTVEGPVTTEAISAPEDIVEQDMAVSTTPDATQQQPSRFGRIARNAGASMLGGIAGSAIGGPIGGLIGSALARETFGANQQPGGLLGGLLGDRSGQGAWAGVGTLNDLGRGAQAAYGAWGGPKGTTGFATDGSRITNLGDGLVSRIDRFGRETFFKDGDTWGGGGGTGGLFGGIFGGSFGDSGRSQADRARDSVGLY